MPAIYDTIPTDLVQRAIIQRGFGFHGNSAYAIQLTKPSTQTFKETGQPKRIVMGGIGKDVLAEILQRARTVDDAADTIIAACSGESVNMGGGGEMTTRTAISEETSLRIILQRVENYLAEQLARFAAEIDTKIAAIESRIVPTTAPVGPAPTGKKRGRPKGSGKRSRELTPEQEQQIRNLVNPTAGQDFLA